MAAIFIFWEGIRIAATMDFFGGAGDESAKFDPKKKRSVWTDQSSP